LSPSDNRLNNGTNDQWIEVSLTYEFYLSPTSQKALPAFDQRRTTDGHLGIAFLSPHSKP
jgi:hypothetical protein